MRTAESDEGCEGNVLGRDGRDGGVCPEHTAVCPISIGKGRPPDVTPPVVWPSLRAFLLKPKKALQERGACSAGAMDWPRRAAHHCQPE